MLSSLFFAASKNFLADTESIDPTLRMNLMNKAVRGQREAKDPKHRARIPKVNNANEIQSFGLCWVVLAESSKVAITHLSAGKSCCLDSRTSMISSLAVESLCRRTNHR